MNICKTYILCGVLSLLIVSHVGAQSTPNYEGTWSGESGWGMSFTHQGDTIFATWVTYGLPGFPLWLSMTASRQDDGSFVGMVDYGGGSLFSEPFDPTLIYHQILGTGRLTFSDANNVTFSYTDFNGYSLAKTLTRFVFAAPVPICTYNGALAATQATNYQGMWVVPAEPGWGISFAHQGDIIFAIWYITTDGYFGSGPEWVSATLRKTAAETYSGALDWTTGPSFKAVPFDPSLVTHKTVGSASVTFADGNNVALTYTLNGVTQTKALTRFVFRERGTVCQ
jgi:hypothetical protein